MALVPTLVTPTKATASSGVATSTSFSPSAGALVKVLFTYMFGTNTTGVTFTVSDSSSNTYSLDFTPLNNGGAGATYVGIATFTYNSAPGSITVKVTASSTGAADCLISPIWFTGQAASQTGAAFASNTSGGTGTTCEQLITPTTTGSYIVIVGGVAAVNVNSTAISGTTLDQFWNDANVGNSANSGITTSTSTGGVQVNVGFTLSGTSTFGYSIAALEILPAGATNTDMPQINPGPTWLDLFKPGLRRARPMTPVNQAVEVGSLSIVVPTLVTSINATTINPRDVPEFAPGPTWFDLFKPGMPRPHAQTVADSTNVDQGALSITIPTLVTSINATTINPRDVPGINPGPTWLDQFKPGWARPRPQTVADRVGPETGLLAIVIPTLVTSINATTINPRDISQIYPGPAWLEHFKPGLPRPVPMVPPGSPNSDFGSLTIPLPTPVPFLQGEVVHAGSLSIVLPAPTVVVTAATINPRDIPQFNPGPTWLDIFKPGLPRPRPFIAPPTGDTGPLAITLPTLVTNLYAVVQNRSSVPQIYPGPTWLAHFKPGNPDPRPITITSLSPFSESGSLVIVIPPGVRSGLESGPLNIVLPTLTPSIQGKRTYGRLNMVLRTPVLGLAGTSQQTEQGVLNIVLPVMKMPLSGRNGRETGTLAITLPTPFTRGIVIGKVVHNGILFIYLGGAAHLYYRRTRNELFGTESLVDASIVLPGLTFDLNANLTREKQAAISGAMRARQARITRRRQLRGARAAVEERRHLGEEDE